MKTFIDIESGGFRPGEIMIMQARRTGKSAYYYPYPPTKSQFEKVDEAIVDGKKWYTVRTRRGNDAGHWLRGQDCAIETSTGWAFDAYFDVPEKIYMMLELKFG